MSVSKVEWPSFTFPALNLWNMPLHEEIVKKINQYYYEHYKHLWEEDQKDTVPYTAIVKLDGGKESVITGRLKL